MENGILQVGQVKLQIAMDVVREQHQTLRWVMKMRRETEHPPIVMDPITKATGFHLTLVKAPSR